MIPFLDGLKPMSKAPVTWIIVALNLFIFANTDLAIRHISSRLHSFYDDDEFIGTQARVYRQYLKKENPKHFLLNSNAHFINIYLSYLALKDQKFLDIAPDLEFSGDRVAINKWKENLAKINQIRTLHPHYVWGVSANNQSFWDKITYQFAHDGWGHLLSNIIFLLIFGAYLEKRWGGLAVLTTYLLGGWLAANLYTNFIGVSGAPLVGASGAVCALSGFIFAKRAFYPTKLFYILLPMRGYFGFVYVQTWIWVFVFWLVDDIAGWIESVPEMSGGVAHFVHLSGFVIGALVSVAYPFETEFSREETKDIPELYHFNPIVFE